MPQDKYIVQTRLDQQDRGQFVVNAGCTMVILDGLHRQIAVQISRRQWRIVNKPPSHCTLKKP